MAIIYDNERYDSFRVIQLTFAENSVFLSCNTTAFPTVFTESVTAHCPSGGVAFKNRTIKRFCGKRGCILELSKCVI